MFLGKRREKEKAEEVAFREQVIQQLQVLAKEMNNTGEVVSELRSDVKQNGKDISRHSMALEDCLDMLEELKEDREQVQKQIKDVTQEREKLLGLFFTYQEQLWNMRAYAAENDSLWYQQLLLVEKVIGDSVLSCGITAIAETGCAVNYEFHDVLEVKDTEDPYKDRTVAAIVKPGYLYKGTVRQKAKVKAYRLRT